MATRWRRVMENISSLPVMALDLTHRLYRQASPHEPVPSGAGGSEKLRLLAIQIDRKMVTATEVLKMIWILLLYVYR